MACEAPIVISETTTLDESIDKIKEFAISGTLDPKVIAIANKCSLTSDPARCAFDTVYDLVVYRPDPMGNQITATPNCTLQLGKGNCVDYSVLLGSILILLGIGYSFKVISYSTSSAYDHIYIRLDDGRILDPVIGQEQTGKATKNNRPSKGQFNKEVQYRFCKLFPMTKLSVLQGLGAMKTGNKYFMPSRVEMSRMGLMQGLNMYNPSGRTWQFQGTTSVYTNDPGGSITNSYGVVASFGSTKDSSGNYAINAPGNYGGGGGTEMFWDGNTLYTTFGGLQFFKNEGKGWVEIDSVAYAPAKVKALAAGAVAAVAPATISPIVIGLGALAIGGAVYWFGFRKKGKKK
jgi:hypothetical protein